jgi:hypothetical protein
MIETRILFFMSILIISQSPLVQVNITSIMKIGVRIQCCDTLHLSTDKANVILKDYNEPGNKITAPVGKYKPAGFCEVEFNILYLKYQFFLDLIKISQKLITSFLHSKKLYSINKMLNFKTALT